MKIIMEVGANNGEDTEKLLVAADLMYAIEPDPALMAGLKQRFAGQEKLRLIESAIALEEADVPFYIMEHERGINSLYPLHPELLNTPLQKHWQYQKGMTGQITVHTVRLDTLMDRFQIPHIDFLWIDAQGNDLIALQSLGDRLKDVKEGRCELTFKVPIYQGVDNSYETATKFLREAGFRHAIVYTHQDESEVDVRFWRE